MSSATDSILAAANIRAELLALVRRELVGPYDGEEIISENPQRRYVVGQLAASEDGDLAGLADEGEFDAESLSSALETDVLDNIVDSDEPAIVEADGDERHEDTNSISKARRESLSSLGISFLIATGTCVSYQVDWGEYSRREDGRFERVSMGAAGSLAFETASPLRSKEHGRLSVKWIAREIGGRLVASLFVVNSTNPTIRDGTERLYQVSVTLRCADDGEGFLSRDELLSDHKSRKTDSMDLLYRNHKEFGVGLHTAVEPILSNNGRCYELRTQTMPAAETNITIGRDFVDSAHALEMAWLASCEDPKATCHALRSLFHGYESWVSELRSQAVILPDEFKDLAEVQIDRILDRVGRLTGGIDLIESDENAFSAFRFANEVMARAQFRVKAKSSYKIGQPIENSARAGTWYPFQLAFVLSLLSDFVSPNGAHRNTVDILFFPTGGGKTEAYLGVAAFVMAYRRFRNKAVMEGAGISTLMRYTLRLLTTQQFMRAATLICSAELVRQEGLFARDLGAVPFSIGLWVGPMTPQRYDDALDSLKRARSEHFTCERRCELSRSLGASAALGPSFRHDSANVLPITECPWCFTPLCVDCVRPDAEARRLSIECPNPACAFHVNSSDTKRHTLLRGLPLLIMDSDIYRMCPTIVIATVDKFATLPFRGEAKALFGRVSRFCAICGFLTDSSEHTGHKDAVEASVELAPLDLIIQDELHTINDNLGSIYGLYETAIEYLARRDGVSPKYVCATATIKEVETQIRSLYGQRRSAVFPPTGLEVGDTFFSQDERASATRPGRQYIGLYAPTFSRLSIFVAVLSAVLASAWRMKQLFGLDAADPYLTLLGYFNTIRDLGGVKSLLGDDVPPVLREIADRNQWGAERRLVQWQEELTGRIGSSEVPDRLRTLQTPYSETAGCDFMAATNMISVGVDVPRLGAMIVDGQPKSTAEYIQATSRVGRSMPGIVFVVYNAMRPRDVSHYEHFYSYHDAYYRFVEAGSITPFSDGAIDRYLASAFVASYRLSVPKSDNDSANRYIQDPDGLNAGIVSAFQERASAFGSHEAHSVHLALSEIQSAWASEPDALKYVVYRNRYASKRKGTPRPQDTVIRASDEEPNPEVRALFAAPRSMRNVEAEVPLRILVDG